MSTEPFVIDLDAERVQRAAAREGKQQDLPIRIGGEVIATLPVELPIDVLEPLRDLDEDVTLVLRSAMQAARTDQDASERRAFVDIIVDVLAANPALPIGVLNTIVQVAKNALTDEGFAALMAARPSPQDFAVLAKGVIRFYGVSLGEASEPSGSSTDSGQTSKPTSLGTTPDSTPETSTPPVAPSTQTVVGDSSGSVAS